MTNTHGDQTAGSPQLAEPLRSRERAARDMALRALRIIARLSDITAGDLIADNCLGLIHERARKTLRDIEALLPEAIKT